MTATFAHVPVVGLPPDERAAFDDVLGPLGVTAVGRRGDELILEVGPSADPDRFDERLITALKSDVVQPYWVTYKSVTYS